MDTRINFNFALPEFFSLLPAGSLPMIGLVLLLGLGIVKATGFLDDVRVGKYDNRATASLLAEDPFLVRQIIERSAASDSPTGRRPSQYNLASN